MAKIKSEFSNKKITCNHALRRSHSTSSLSQLVRRVGCKENRQKKMVARTPGGEKFSPLGFSFRHLRRTKRKSRTTRSLRRSLWVKEFTAHLYKSNTQTVGNQHSVQQTCMLSFSLRKIAKCRLNLAQAFSQRCNFLAVLSECLSVTFSDRV